MDEKYLNDCQKSIPLASLNNSIKDVIKIWILYNIGYKMKTIEVVFDPVFAYTMEKYLEYMEGWLKWLKLN